MAFLDPRDPRPTEHDRALARLGRQFMTPDVEYMACWQVETSEGTETIPADLVGPRSACDALTKLREYLKGDPILDADGGLQAERVDGWYARLSANGYLDCTDWSGPHETQYAAEEYLIDAYDDGDDDEDDGGVQ